MQFELSISGYRVTHQGKDCINMARTKYGVVRINDNFANFKRIRIHHVPDMIKRNLIGEKLSVRYSTDKIRTFLPLEEELALYVTKGQIKNLGIAIDLMAAA